MTCEVVGREEEQVRDFGSELAQAQLANGELHKRLAEMQKQSTHQINRLQRMVDGLMLLNDDLRAAMGNLQASMDRLQQQAQEGAGCVEKCHKQGTCSCQ